MRIATLSIGDELICGQVVDTNAAGIASALMANGLRVTAHVTVGDDATDIETALEGLTDQYDILIVTGGLGPTEDDITAAAAAAVTGRPLVLDRYAAAHIDRILRSLNLLYASPPGDKQALVPEQSVIIPNPTGTACGFHLLHNGCRIFFLPGVPGEMFPMLHDSVIPILLDRAGGHRAIRNAVFNIFGPPEAEAGAALEGIADPANGVFLGICVTFPWIRVTVRVEASTEEAAVSLLEPAAARVRERLAPWLFAEGDCSMEQAVAELFVKTGLTLSLAESCTGGMIAQRVTAIPGSSAWFREGAVTYSNEAKSRQLGVPPALLEQHGAVSGPVAEAMATGIKNVSGTDIGLAVTGIAGPDGGSEEKPVGTVFLSLASAAGCRTQRFRFFGNRDNIRVMTTWTALDWLRRELICPSTGKPDARKGRARRGRS